LPIQAHSGGIQNLPQPDFNLSTSIAEGDILVYKTATKSFDNTVGNFTTLEQVNALIANINSGGNIDLSNYVTTTALATEIATLNTSIATKADTTYVDAQIAAIHSLPDLSSFVTNAVLSATIANYDLSTEVTSKINTAIAAATYFDGDYNNLFNTPTIPSLDGYATQLWVQGQIGAIDVSDLTDTTNLLVHTTAFSGSYDDLTNKPTLFDGAYSSLTGAPTIPVDVGDLTDTGNLLGSGGATTLGALTDVSTAGVTTGQVLKYNGTSWVPAADDTSGGGGSNADTLDSQDGTYYLDYTNFTNTPTLFDGVFGSLTSKPTTIAGYGITDAFDGAYSSLTGAPTIPADVSDLTDTTNLLTHYTNSDVDAHLNQSNPTSGYVLSWNGTDYAWVAQTGGGGGGATTLGALTDVSSTSPTDGQVLKWDNANSTWAPAVDATTGSGGSNFATEAYVDQSIIAIGAHWPGDYNALTNLPTLFSGSFPDLNNKPTTIAGYGITDSPDSILDLSISDGTVGQVLTTDGAGNFSFTSAGSFSGDYNALSNLPNLFSGNYNDLSNQPYIPSIAGLAATSYVDAKHAEAEILGDKSFTDSITQVAKVSNVVAATHENFVMSITTTDATPTEALLTTGNRIIIDDDSTVMYKVHIVASDGTDHYGIRVQGLINQTSGTLTLIGGQSTETLVDSLNASTSAVSADSSNSSLKVLVTGEAAKTIIWTIFVELNAVKR